MSPADKRRVLLIAHNFPPLAGGGVHRPLKFARYLSELGWQVEVLTVKPIRYHAYDASLLEEIPAVPIHRAGSLELLRFSWLAGWRPRATPSVGGFADWEAGATGVAAAIGPEARLFKNISDFFFQPDKEIGWFPFAVHKGFRLIRRRPFNVILTTSPPETCHLVGAVLKKITGVLWVADFRDAWSEIHWRRRLIFIHGWFNRFLERSVLRYADGIIANNDAMAEAMSRLAGPLPQLLVLPNGFDPADFGAPLPKTRPEDFVVAHIGSFRGGRVARHVLAGFAAARARDAEFRDRAKLFLIGINRYDDVAAVRALGLAGAAFAVGYVAHRDALRACLGADLLLLVMSSAEGPALVPGKLYEYLGSGKPLMAVIPEGAAARVIADATRGAIVVPAEDEEGVAEGFLKAFRRSKAADARYLTVPDRVAAYARPAQVRRLASFLDGIIDLT